MSTLFNYLWEWAASFRTREQRAAEKEAGQNAIKTALSEKEFLRRCSDGKPFYTRGVKLAADEEGNLYLVFEETGCGAASEVGAKEEK